MATYAQILGGVVKNTIVLDNASLVSVFSKGFDSLIEIDQIVPTPGIGWTYDGTNFAAPAAAQPSQALNPFVNQILNALVTAQAITAAQLNIAQNAINPNIPLQATLPSNAGAPAQGV